MENEGLQPYVNTLEAEQELNAFELENSRPPHLKVSFFCHRIDELSLLHCHYLFCLFLRYIDDLLLL